MRMSSPVIMILCCELDFCSEELAYVVELAAPLVPDAMLPFIMKLFTVVLL